MSRFTIRYLGWVLIGAAGALGFFSSLAVFLLLAFLVALIVMLVSRQPEDRRPQQSPGVFVGVALVGLFIYSVNPQVWQLLPVCLVLIGLGAGLPLVSRRAITQPHT